MADTVFVGPTLAADEVAALLPGARVAPPVRHGDLLRLDPAPGDRVLIVDGLFLQSAPVRHREVLDVLARGVAVAGASSMGALRAAELWPFGMRGIGRVFAMYRDGTVTGDDEVAVVYGPAEDGYRQLSRPLVDVRRSLDLAVRAGVLDRPGAGLLLDAVRALPFRVRGPAAVERAAHATLGPVAAARYLEWARRHPVDLKADDARLLLRLAAAGSPLCAPPGPGDRLPTSLDTGLLDRWRSRFRGEVRAGRHVPDADAVAVVTGWHPGFPAAHRRRVLADLVGPGPHLERRAVASARARGIDPDRPGGLGDWLDPAEQDLPPDERLLRFLVRAFGVRRCAGQPLSGLPPELRERAVLDRARRFARRCAEVNDRLPRPDPARPGTRRQFLPDIVESTLRTAWERPTGSLRPDALDRGFRSVDRAVRVLEPLVGAAVVTGENPFG